MDLYVFIVENEALAKSLISKHFKADQITYAAMFNRSRRQVVTGALDAIDDAPRSIEHKK